MSISKKTYDEAKTKGDQKSIIKASVGYQKYLTLRAVRWSFTIYRDNYNELIRATQIGLNKAVKGIENRKQDRLISLGIFNTITSCRSFSENVKKVLEAEKLTQDKRNKIEDHETNNFFRAFRNYLMHNGVNITTKKLTFTNETDLIEKKIAVKTTPISDYLEVWIEKQKDKGKKTGFDEEALNYLESKSPELDILNELILQRKLMTEMYTDFLKDFISKNGIKLNKLKADLDNYHMLPPSHLRDIILKIPFRHFSILLKSSKIWSS
jgi:hypothetical protein